MLQVIPSGNGGQLAPVSSVTATSSNTSVLTTVVNGDKVKIVPVSTGNATVTITAHSQAGDNKSIQVAIAVKTVFDYLTIESKRGDDANGEPYAYYEDVVTISKNSTKVTFDSLHGTGRKYDVNVVDNGNESFTLTPDPDADTNCYFTARLKVGNKQYGTGSMRFVLNPNGGYNLQSATIKCNVQGTTYNVGGNVTAHVGDTTKIMFDTVPDVYCKASDNVLTVVSSDETVVRSDGEVTGYQNRRDFGLTILQAGNATITATIADAKGFTKTEVYNFTVE